jgi:hypothetical protein
VFCRRLQAYSALSAQYPFIYPAYSAPNFAALGDADPSQDATVCNLDESKQVRCVDLWCLPLILVLPLPLSLLCS